MPLPIESTLSAHRAEAATVATAHRLDRIDVLRGVAIALVVLHHFYLTFLQAGVRAEIVPGPAWLNQLIFIPHELGYLGVQLFFVLSGFCIHNSYLGWRRKTSVRTVRGFLLNYFNRRFWRIYPPYLFALLGTFAIVYWPVFDARAFRHLAIHLALANTLFEGFFYNINHAFWSIAVEWQLYLIYPLLLWLTQRIGVWRAVLVATAIAAFWRAGVPAMTDRSVLRNLPFFWWFEWCLGFLIADLRASGRVAFPRASLLALVLIPGSIFALKAGAPWILTWLLPPLAFAALLQAVCGDARPLGRIERLLCTLGISSYSLYLLHNPILWGIRSLLREVAAGLPPVVVWTVIFAAAFGVMQLAAWLMFRLIEQPSIAQGQRIERDYLPRLTPRPKPIVPVLP
jgi:peptidoglycan/LPS O-acetylase OafA/YrhL